ncbi:MAG: histidine kinase [Nostoc sp. GBBB01]|nr:histidine kinase [Nostoc sp. GBBB01]
MGDKVAIFLPFPPCSPCPHAPCPMPHAPCPIPQSYDSKNSDC